MSFTKKKYLENLPITESDHRVEIVEKIKLDDILYNIKLIYENKPINLRRLEIIENDKKTQMGFFNLSFEKSFNKKFFSMVDPYIN